MICRLRASAESFDSIAAAGCAVKKSPLPSLANDTARIPELPPVNIDAPPHDSIIDTWDTAKCEFKSLENCAISAEGALVQSEYQPPCPNRYNNRFSTHTTFVHPATFGIKENKRSTLNRLQNLSQFQYSIHI